MSTASSSVSPQRVLKPASGKILNEGAPFVQLSPHKSVRNASIIYDAIKNLPDQTLIRGDFDKKSRPLIYFPERPPKQIGKAAVDAIAAKNISHDRAEFASFMSSIVEATFKAADPHSPELHAVFNLRSATIHVMKERRDFTVGDIKASLRSIAKANNRKILKNITSPHRTPPGSTSPLRAKRLKQFFTINAQLTGQLSDALSYRLKGKHADSIALDAISEMKKMAFTYSVLRDTENLSFADFLQQRPISEGVYTFAKLWLTMNGPDWNGRVQFCTEAWALEMDRVCPMIVNEYRAAKQKKQAQVDGDAPQENTQSSEATKAEPAKETQQETTSVPEAALKIEPKTEPVSAPIVRRTPRVLRRRLSRLHSPGSPIQRTVSLSSSFSRQSSVPQLRIRTEQDLSQQSQ